MKTNLSQLLFCCLFLLLSFQLEAATYYFSTSIGDDSRSAGQAQNPSTPWRSIEKLNAIFSSLGPGDRVMFRRGEVYYGTINLNSSGSSANPIFIGAYGSGNKPVITSLVRVTQWRSVGNGVFAANHTQLSSDPMTTVLFNNEKQEMGRYPNSDAPNRGYLTYRANGNRSITSSELGSSPNWAGGEIVMRKLFWIIDRHTITSHSGTTLNFGGNPDSNYNPTSNYGFFIQNHINTLDKLGEWFYNRSNRTFNMYFGGASPSNYNVRVSTLRNLVTNSGTTSHITFDNLEFNGSNGTLFSIESGTNVRVVNCDFYNAGDNGLFISGIDQFLIENSKVVASSNNGIMMATSHNATIKNNLVKDTYLIPGLTRGGDNRGVSIFSTSNNNVIENNEVINSGYIGIRFGGNNTLVKNNYINSFAMTKNDGGGIYSYSGRTTTFRNRKVVDNIILNGLGVKEGTNLRNHISLPQSEGIYLDDNVTGVEVTGNTIAHVSSRGIYLHNTSDIVIRNNTVYDSRTLFYAKNDHMGNELRNIVVENNQFLTKNALQNHVLLWSNRRDIQSFGTFRNNHYMSPFDDDFRFSTVIRVDGTPEEIQTYDLRGWQSQVGKDANSKFSTSKFDLVEDIKKVGQNKYDNGSFDRNVNGVGCNGCNTSWDNSGKLDGGSLKASFRNSGLLSMGIGELKKGRRYLMKFSSVANVNVPLSLYVRQAGSPWQRLSGYHTIEITSRRGENEVIFTPIADMESSRVEFRLSQQQNADVWIDNLEFHEIQGIEYSTEDFVIFDYNKGNSRKTLSLGGVFKDVLQNTFDDRITLDPFESVILLSSSGKVDRPMEEPKIEIASPANNSKFDAGDEIEIAVKTTLNGGNITKVDYFNNGNLIGSSESSPFSFVWRNPSEGNHRITAVAYGDNNTQSSSSPVNTQILALSAPPTNEKDQDQGDAGEFSLFINAGSNSSTTLEGYEFVGESSSSNFHSTSSNHFNGNASEFDLFKSERFASDFSYKIPVPNGTYTVHTLHNETWFGKGGASATEGRRVFDLVIEGRNVKSDIDLYLENNNEPVMFVFEEIQVNDGYLDIELNGTTNNATISGLIVQGSSMPNINLSLEASSPETPIATNQQPLYINTGSHLDVRHENKTFVGDVDSGYYGESREGGDINAPVDVLFQSERFAENLEFNIPVENGTYKVVTYHSETWFGRRGPSPRAGRRVFDIIIEGVMKKKDFDIFVENENAPMALEHNDVVVSDGVLSMNMVASADRANVSGIAIIPINGEIVQRAVQTLVDPIFINAGASANAVFQDAEFVGDMNTKFYSSSNTNINRSVTNEALFSTERWGWNLSYKVPVENGVYTVMTLHHELWFGSFGPSAQPGRRVFDIYLEGDLVKKDFDMFLESRNEPVVLTFEDIRVSDGVLNLDMAASQNNATLSGLAIIPKGGTVPISGANMRVLSDDFKRTISNEQNSAFKASMGMAKLYPNPASSSTHLEFDTEISIKSISIYGTNGQLMKWIDPKEARDYGNRYLIPVDDLKNGVYILTIEGDDEETEKMRLVVK